MAVSINLAIRYLQHIASVVLRISVSDFSKAFDHIDHTIAVSKLLQMDIPHSLVAWISNFLTKHQQCARYGKALSNWTTMHAGVPQGTKLGPVVFLAVINDAWTSEVSTKIYSYKYVDDLTVIETSKVSTQSQLQTVLDELHNWSTENQMCLNQKKCAVEKRQHARM